MLTTKSGWATAELGLFSTTLTLVTGAGLTSTFVLIEGAAWDLTLTPVDVSVSEDTFSLGQTLLLGLMSAFCLVSMGFV